MNNFIKIHPQDNCAVALIDLEASKNIDELSLCLSMPIPTGHKFALDDIKEGSDIVKYGNPIGIATAAIKRGEHIHTHNMKTKLYDLLEYHYTPENKRPTLISSSNPTKSFMGYERADGKVGIRNDIYIIPLVGCINGICQVAASQFRAKYANELLSSETRIIVLDHPYGCSQLGDDLDTTKKILQNFTVHPNAGGVLVIGLGCENNTLNEFLKDIPKYDKKRMLYFNAQDVDDELAYAEELLDQLYKNIRNDKRSLQPFSKLKIGLKCGGSDGLSGITANPLLGSFSDYFCAHGGTTILTEVPEMFGAEHILMSRAENRDVFEQIVGLINDFKLYYKKNEQPIYENPSPGNKKGGITTLEEKSLGCTQKSGLAAITDVLTYGDISKKSGLQLLSAPGNDLIAVTALAAAGCQLVLFTTGRGTAFGGIVPTIKISSNSRLAQHKKHWIDFDAGVALEEGMSFEQLTENLLAYILHVAEGEYVSHEKIQQFMLSIWKFGVTL